MKKELYITTSNKFGNQYNNNHVEGYAVWEYKVDDKWDSGALSSPVCIKINQTKEDVIKYVTNRINRKGSKTICPGLDEFIN